LPACEGGVFQVDAEDGHFDFGFAEGRGHLRLGRAAAERIDADSGGSDGALADDGEVGFHLEKTSAALEPPKPRLTLMTWRRPGCFSPGATRAGAISGMVPGG